MEKILLEVCADSTESAIAAQKGGADRVELCGNLVIGGTTPGQFLFDQIRENTKLPIRVLIRPRFGDFCYSEYEFRQILGEIKLFKERGADAIVTGILTEDGEIHMDRMAQIMELAGDMEVTFHRAFDVCKDPFRALEQIRQLGIGTILTSGQQNSFQKGKETLKELVRRAGDDVSIMAGAGVTPETLESSAKEIGAKAYHMSGKITLDSSMRYRKEGVNMGLPALSEFEIWRTDEAQIRKARQILDALNSEE